jgi:hypothetical protein
MEGVYTYILLRYFIKQLKPLAKKYRSIPTDIVSSLESFNPALEKHLGDGVYKMRIKMKTLTKGKSGSLRMLVLLIRTKSRIIPFAIYYKDAKENISDIEIENHMSNIKKEIQIYL